MESTELKKKLIKGFANDTFLKLKIQDGVNQLTTFSISKYMPFSLYPTAHLEGSYTDVSGQRVVTIKVRPSLFHLIFVIGVIVYLIREFYLFSTDSQNIGTTIFVTCLCIVAFVIDYILALGFSNNLKENLEDTLALNASETTATNTSFMQ
jgi:hypothetical protein